MAGSLLLAAGLATATKLVSGGVPAFVSAPVQGTAARFGVVGGRAYSPVQAEASRPGQRSAGWGLASIAPPLALAACIAACRAGSRKTRRNATPQTVPVLDMDGKQIGEETVDFKTFSKESAAYAVHQVYVVWQYQQKEFTAFVRRRSDHKKGPKPYAQKGSGRARQGSRYSPLFGKTATNKAPHGLDNRANKKTDRIEHCGAISTVLQSKWRGIKIIQGLEDVSEARQGIMEERIRAWTGLEPGSKSVLMIARNGYGEEDKYMCLPTPAAHANPLYTSTRLIPKLELRRPRDIDPRSDGLHQCLKGRQLLISREAFFDLTAKFGREPRGWAFMTPRQILVEQLGKLAAEYPLNRAGEVKAARELPRLWNEREEWAKEKRDKLALKEVA